MSFGRMNGFAEIIAVERANDDEGFTADREEIIASVRCWREGRHGSERWANLASFSEATDLFRIRKIPGVRIDPGYFLVCGDERFNIISVEDVKGRGMYLEILAQKVVSSLG